MRVTTETRQRTRAALLAAARERFAAVGFERTTTRDLASAAGVATGTLFNYFRTKEQLGLALVEEALAAADGEFAGLDRQGASLEERLFTPVAVELRHLEPLRAWLGELLEAGLSPLRADADAGPGAALRLRQLERVARALREEGDPIAEHSESPVDLHLYWSLYLGVLGFWARDDSEHQESSLALLDRSIRLFCRAVRGE